MSGGSLAIGVQMTTSICMMWPQRPVTSYFVCVTPWYRKDVASPSNVGLKTLLQHSTVYPCVLRLSSACSQTTCVEFQ